MDEEMMDRIADALKELGFLDVHTDCGYVMYTEYDGTKHRLVEDTFVDGAWEGDVYGKEVK